MIKIKDLNFAYSRKSRIFEGISLEIKQGYVYGLLGKNGVGKSTLLKLITGLVFPQKGSAMLFDTEAKERNPDVFQRIFFVPEEFTVPPYSMLKYGRIFGKFYPSFDMDKMFDYLKDFEVEVTDRLDKMSMGQRKKAILSFAFACNTELLLLDEPTNGLDIPSKQLFRKIVADSMSDDKTIIMSTHQVREFDQLIDAVIILENNEILLNEGFESISEKLSFKYLTDEQNVLYSENGIHGKYGVVINEAKEDSEINIEALFNAVIRNGDIIQKLFNN